MGFSSNVASEKMVKAVSLQDPNPGGRVWISKIYDRSFGKGIETKLLSINTQRMSLSQKSQVSGYFLIENCKFCYTNIQNYLLVVILSQNFNNIRENNLIKSLRSFISELLPSINPESISNNAILMVQGWDEMIIDGDYFQFPFNTLTLLKMHSTNEDEYNKRSELAQRQLTEEYRAKRNDERIQRGKTILNNIKNGIKVAISEADKMTDGDFDSFSMLRKKTQSIFANTFKDDEENLIQNRQESKIVDLNNGHSKGQSNEKFSSISKMMKKVQVSSEVARANTPSCPAANRIFVQQTNTFTVDSDCSIVSSSSLATLDLTYKSESASNIKITAKNTDKKNLKVNPKVKKANGNEFIVPVNNSSSSIKILRWDENPSSELPFPITSWVHQQPGGTIEDVLLEFNIGEFEGLMSNLKLVLSLESGCSEPNFKSSPLGNLCYKQSESEIVWALDFIEKGCPNQIIEFSVFGMSSMKGTLSFDVETVRDIFEVESFEIGNESNWDKVDIDCTKKMKNVVKMSF